MFSSPLCEILHFGPEPPFSVHFLLGELPIRAILKIQHCLVLHCRLNCNYSTIGCLPNHAAEEGSSPMHRVLNLQEPQRVQFRPTPTIEPQMQPKHN